MVLFGKKTTVFIKSVIGLAFTFHLVFFTYTKMTLLMQKLETVKVQSITHLSPSF